VLRERREVNRVYPTRIVRPNGILLGKKRVPDDFRTATVLFTDVRTTTMDRSEADKAVNEMSAPVEFYEHASEVTESPELNATIFLRSIWSEQVGAVGSDHCSRDRERRRSSFSAPPSTGRRSCNVRSGPVRGSP